MSKIEGKAAIVTGGSKGIGLAIARALAYRGANVFICARGKAALDGALEDLRSKAMSRVEGTTCDVRDYEQVREMINKAAQLLGGVDILINNAGVGFFRSIEELSIEEWKATIETNLSGAFYCSKAAIPLMKRRGGGFIINIGSLAGKNAFAGGTAYNASKFGLVGFSEALLQDVRYDHIRVCCIMPGSVNTGFSGRDRAEDWKLMPEDVAMVVVSVLEIEPRAMASLVELRPSEPRK
jgi:NAD(P)-dependent dehydrogenase (short-subunit alcohol dehydrogenase family)